MPLRADPQQEDEDGPSRSARHALTELQLKARLLVEERDYYQSLFTTSQHAFAEHRRELAHLEEKERAYLQGREASLQKDLNDLLAANAALQAEVTSHREQRPSSERLHASVDAFRLAARENEISLQRSIDASREELAILRSSRMIDEKKLDLLRRELEESTTRREALAFQGRLERERDELSPRRASGSVNSLGTISRGVASRGQLPFVPSGCGTSRNDKTSMHTATHNVHAMLQTARKTTYRSPPRASREVHFEYEPTHQQLQAMAHSLSAELQELRTEYGALKSSAVGATPSDSLVSRMRAVVKRMDDKNRQLDAVRASQSRLKASFDINRVIQDSYVKDRQCTELHDSLIEVLRAPAA